MPFIFSMPKLSPTMEEGMVARWLKKEGDFVAADEPLLEIATDKATVESSSLDEGWLRKVLIAQGKNVSINTPLAILSEKKDEDIAHLLAELEKKPAKEERPAAPKATGGPATAPSSAPSYRQEPIFVPEPPLASYDFGKLKGARGRVKASPLAKKLAQEKGLDLATVRGSGPDGRIESRDLEQAKPTGSVSFQTEELPEHLPGSYEEIELSPMRKAIGRRLQESKSFIPHFYLKRTIDAGPLVDCRNSLEAPGVKLTYNDFLLRACALALVRHPKVNSGYNSQNQTIIAFKTVDIAVAVGFEGGLITPIIRHANFKSIRELSEEMQELKARAKAGKLSEQEYKGGSFTLSNLGMYGVSEFTAVINPPQAAILAVGNVEDAAVVKEGRVLPGKVLHLTLSCDHRVIDGAEGALFLATLKTLLENPAALLIS